MCQPPWGPGWAAVVSTVAKPKTATLMLNFHMTAPPVQNVMKARRHGSMYCNAKRKGSFPFVDQNAPLACRLECDGLFAAGTREALTSNYKTAELMYGDLFTPLISRE